MKYNRRRFIRNTGLGILALGLPPMAFASQEAFQFVFPVDGDVLHKSDGAVIKNGLKLKPVFITKGVGPLQVSTGGAFRKLNNDTTLILKQGENTIRVKTETGAISKIKVFYAPHLNKQYRISIDDAIWFLRDIHQNREVYTSIFDNPFLKYFKEVHDRNGLKLHINLFYETEGFNLSDMTDKFKKEWMANAGWIRLSIHARAEFPDNPYINAGYEDIKKDALLINKEIERFAGRQLINRVTTLHWGEVPVEVCRGLRDSGYKVLVCDFNVDNNLPPCSYYLTAPQRRHMNKRFIWHDNKEDITFVRSSIIVDTVKHENIVHFLNSYASNKVFLPYVDFLVHEQYFYSFYHNHQPDYTAKLNTCIRWAEENGYHPGFVDESLKF